MCTTLEGVLWLAGGTAGSVTSAQPVPLQKPLLPPGTVAIAVTAAVAPPHPQSNPNVVAQKTWPCCGFATMLFMVTFSLAIASFICFAAYRKLLSPLSAAPRSNTAW